MIDPTFVSMSNYAPQDPWGPTSMLASYKSIPVTLSGQDGGPITIAVNSYENLSHAACVKTLPIKDLIVGLGNGLLGGLAPFHVMNVFSGKGSVDEFTRVLQIIYDQSDTLLARGQGRSGVVGDFCALIANSDPWDNTLQAIADNYLGLDCNGFVGNWLAASFNVSIGPQTSPRQIFHALNNKGFSQRMTPGDIANNDVIVWQDYGHIAAIDSPDASGHFYVCQSNGNGPNLDSWTIISNQGDGTFTLNYPSAWQTPNGVVGGPVWIIATA